MLNKFLAKFLPQRLRPCFTTGLQMQRHKIPQELTQKVLNSFLDIFSKELLRDNLLNSVTIHLQAVGRSRIGTELQEITL